MFNPLDRLGRVETGLERLAERGDKRHEENQEKLADLSKTTSRQLEALRLELRDIMAAQKSQNETLTNVMTAARWLAFLVASAIVGLLLKGIMPGLGAP